MSPDREDLHELVDRLRAEDAELARRLLEQLLRSPPGPGDQSPNSRTARAPPHREGEVDLDADLDALLDEMEPHLAGLREFPEHARSGYNP